MIGALSGIWGCCTTHMAIQQWQVRFQMLYRETYRKKVAGSFLKLESSQVPGHLGACNHDCAGRTALSAAAGTASSSARHAKWLFKECGKFGKAALQVLKRRMGRNMLEPKIWVTPRSSSSRGLFLVGHRSHSRLPRRLFTPRQSRSTGPQLGRLLHCFPLGRYTLLQT